MKDEYFPKNGVGRIIMNRPKLMKYLLDKVLYYGNTKESGHSLYIRGTFGSGKTVILWLLGRELQRLGETVLYIDHAKSLESFQPEKWKEFEKGFESKKLFVLIDEVHHNKDSPHWVYLLKTSENIVTIGAGIPDIELSPQFMVKESSSLLLLTEDEVDDALTSQLMESFAQCGESLLW